eukprot:984124-Amphidinium_carterae.1
MIVLCSARRRPGWFLPACTLYCSLSSNAGRHFDNNGCMELCPRDSQNGAKRSAHPCKARSPSNHLGTLLAMPTMTTARNPGRHSLWTKAWKW